MLKLEWFTMSQLPLASSCDCILFYSQLGDFKNYYCLGHYSREHGFVSSWGNAPEPRAWAFFADWQIPWCELTEQSELPLNTPVLLEYPDGSGSRYSILVFTEENEDTEAIREFMRLCKVSRWCELSVCNI